jgi:hypothetical protein
VQTYIVDRVVFNRTATAAAAMPHVTVNKLYDSTSDLHVNILTRTHARTAASAAVVVNPFRVNNSIC